MNDEAVKALRASFPEEVVGQLPKGGVQLDYVGHAAVTDRLLSVDPLWSWEPLSLDEAGLPQYDKANGLWIKLTICGVSRLGYGDGPDPKQRIGDAIRNAAMRFGVALDLWSKDELESQVETPTPRKRRAPRLATAGPETDAPPTASRQAPPVAGAGLISQAQLGKISALFREKQFPDDREIRHNYVAAVVGHTFESTKELTKREASTVIDALAAEAVEVAPMSAAPLTGEEPY